MAVDESVVRKSVKRFNDSVKGAPSVSNLSALPRHINTWKKELEASADSIKSSLEVQMELNTLSSLISGDIIALENLLSNLKRNGFSVVYVPKGEGPKTAKPADL